jgi:hypothetical protein
MIAILNPEPAIAVLVGEGHAPLSQYFKRLPATANADESIAAPKGRGSRTPGIFACKPRASWGPLKGAVMPMVDPSARHPPRLGRAGPGPDGGRGSCRRWGGTSRVRQKPDEPISAPKGAPFTHRRCFA